MYVLLLSFNTEKVGGGRFIELHLFFQISEGIMLEEVEFRSCRTIGRKLEEEFEWDWLLGTKKDTRWWVWSGTSSVSQSFSTPSIQFCATALKPISGFSSSESVSMSSPIDSELRVVLADADVLEFELNSPKQRLRRF
jgi:hypothetical protein